jgi:hypothetical protein
VQFPTPSQAAECDGPCWRPSYDPEACDCGLRERAHTGPAPAAYILRVQALHGMGLIQAAAVFGALGYKHRALMTTLGFLDWLDVAPIEELDHFASASSP